VVQYTQEQLTDTLRIHLYRGTFKTSFVYYEDDGQTDGNERGLFHRRLLRFDPGKNEFSLERPEGSFATKFTAVSLVLHGFPPLVTVLVNGRRDPVSGNVIAFPNAAREIVVRWQ
jgi:alpha-glucosidase